MEPESIFSTVLGDLVNDRIQLEQELERCLNLDIPVPEKVAKIKAALKEVTVNDLMIGKWKSYLPSTVNNEDSNTEENGQTE